MSTNETSTSADKVSLLRLAARRLRQITQGEIPQRLNEKARLAVLDYLGAIASGLQAPWAPQVVRYARRRGGVREAHTWGLQEDVSAETAAFVNATLAHR